MTVTMSGPNNQPSVTINMLIAGRTTQIYYISWMMQLLLVRECSEQIYVHRILCTTYEVEYVLFTTLGE